MNYNIPVVLLKNLVILPNQEIKLELNNKITNKTIKEASLKYKGEVLVVAPTDALEEEPSVVDLPKVGVIARIRNKIDVRDSIQVKIKGVKRVAVNKYFNKENDEVLYSEVMYIDLPSLVPEEANATLKKLVDVLKKYISLARGASNDIVNYVVSSKDLDKVTDAIASYLPFKINKKLEYMQNINPLNRAKALIRDMNEEIKALELDEELESKINNNLVEDQNKYFLKEKLKVIKEELGESSWKEIDTKNFLETVNKLKIDKKIKEHILHEIEKYEVMSESSPEVSVLRNYLDWVVNLPWNKETKETTNFNNVLNDLNKTHYGLDKIKERITEYVAIKNLNKNIASPIICLVGPPGVGKTSIAMAIADSLNRRFEKICVGGLNDSTELVGSRRTYLASSPGKIIQGIKKCGSKNPVILIDEVDKMVKDYKGDPASTLLEILDPVQNKFFVDNYVELPFDLSNVLFILTANNINDIPSAILDRVEVIELNSYTLFEKKDIAKKYILPRVLSENMVYDSKIKFDDDLLYFIINNYTKEAGVRDLERVLDSLARKITINNVKILDNERVVKLLGNPKYDDKLVVEENIGVVNTLAYTPFGGIVTKVEVTDYKGDGIVNITGNTGDIIQESVKVVISLVKNKYRYSLNNTDLHFHFLDASTKKDGPSAGLSIAMALLSLLEKQIISGDVAFTGEVSLNGNVLKIGGLKEKLIGAYNSGIKVVYIPIGNKKDLEDVPKIVLDSLEVIPIEKIDELYKKFFK